MTNAKMKGAANEAATGAPMGGAALEACAKGVDEYARSLERSLAVWQAAGDGFLQAMARDYGQASGDLLGAQSPLEALGAEQALILARANAYAELFTRIGEACIRPLGEGEAPLPTLPE